MLARPEWNEPERRERMHAPSQKDDIRMFVACVVASLMVWVIVIFPLLDVLHRRSVEIAALRFEAELR